ncbi:MAG: metallophosphoesterase [Deltaproteobacteria bacterium]|jgi:predicted MPP superfamily phosphohydrolase|nr:metallophosphoesterase [Deltaproteobacteria bacterium]
MTPFRLALLGLFAIGQLTAWFLWNKRLKGLVARSSVKTAYILINLTAAIAIAQMYVLERIPPDPFLWSYLYRPALTWEFAHVMWLAVAAALYLGSIALAPIIGRPPKGLPQLFRAKKSRLTVFHWIFMAWLVCLGAAYYGYWVQLGPANVKRITVSSPNLPPELEGLRIVHLSDFHYGLGSDYLDLERRLLQAAALKPDLVIMTGDLLDSKATLARDFREPLKRLEGVPLGVYGVLGNHDVYTGQPNEEVRLLLTGGLKILRDEAISLPKAPITLVGFDDSGARSVFYKPDPAGDTLNFKAIKGYPGPPGNYLIVIRHRPQGLVDAAQAKADLYLAGHTHGGQFQFPFWPRLNVMTFSYQFTQGTYYLAPTTLIISNGLAAAGLPFRLGAWPEIGLITLTSRPVANPEDQGLN